MVDTANGYCKAETKLCCTVWRSMVDSVKVTPYDRTDDKVAKALEKIMKYQMGNYCPTCGKKL